MNDFIEFQRPIIERTGMGLLPGLAIALFLSMALIAGIMVGSWLVLAAVVVGIFAVTGVVLAVIAGLLGDDDDIYSSADKL